MERVSLLMTRLHRESRPWQGSVGALYHRYRRNWEARSTRYSLLHSEEVEVDSSSFTRSCGAKLSCSLPVIERLKRAGSRIEPPAVPIPIQHSPVYVPRGGHLLLDSYRWVSHCLCPLFASSSLLSASSQKKSYGGCSCEMLGELPVGDSQSLQQKQHGDGDLQGMQGIALASRSGLKICDSSRPDVSLSPRTMPISTPGHLRWLSSSARSDRGVRSGSTSMMSTAGDPLQEDDEEDKWGTVFPDPLSPETNQQTFKKQPITTRTRPRPRLQKLPLSNNENDYDKIMTSKEESSTSITGQSSPSGLDSTSSTRSSLTQRTLKEEPMSRDSRNTPLGISENDLIPSQGQTSEGYQQQSNSSSAPTLSSSSGSFFPSFTATLQCQQSTSVPLAPPLLPAAARSSPGWASRGSSLSSPSSSAASSEEEWSSSLSVSSVCSEASEKGKEDEEEEEEGREKNSALSCSNPSVSHEEEDEDVLPPSDAESHGFSFGNVMLPGLSRKDLERLLLESGEQLQLGDENVPRDRQRSLTVAIIGAPNAGKSMLTNRLVGTKVSAVSRKTNTTRMEMLGVVCKGDTQLQLYDTPGMAEEFTGGSQTLSKESGHLAGIARRVAAQCDVVAVLVDAERQIRRPDPRVRNLVSRLGKVLPMTTKRVLCLNKVDAVGDKKDLLALTSDLTSLGIDFDRVFMVSARKGSGVEVMLRYFIDQAALQPWEVEPGRITDRTLKDLALEIVREHIYNRVHKELPYIVEQKHIKWRVCRDDSVVVSQLVIVETEHQKMIVVGKSGLVIRQIGQGARLELEQLLQRRVHLFLDVIVRPSRRRLPFDGGQLSAHTFRPRRAQASRRTRLVVSALAVPQARGEQSPALRRRPSEVPQPATRLIPMTSSDPGHKDGGDPAEIAQTDAERTRLTKTETNYSFGPHPIHFREVFLVTSLSYAFVNLKPVVPGHVLVSPKRVVQRYADLTSAEVVDLWQVAHRIARKLEAHHDATSLTLTIQDSKEAGQAVPHVHVHIVPRKGGDFTPNDEVYDAIDESEEKLSETLNLDKMRQERTPEDMAAEAATLRPLFAESVENGEESEEKEDGK
ncbi:hypothetical protein CBR_g3497 [Chara braunii]|uniref:Bis(5'-adenosyl)-triphosphatase n=1 Tax=Chara braunii TaxID=69332 RepID=A0A388JR53_CHABU|nr:hypothetical protein CBR_g3497 [Chara braunii]|eukprot:GBG60253.1 hypothetical protein CBR_g3497 [Chara braunii]